MSARVVALVYGLFLMICGCTPKPPGVEPECMQGVKTPLVDIPGIEQLGIVSVRNSTTEVSTSGGLSTHSITSEANHWAVRLPPPNESVMILIEPGSKADKTGFAYSILSNDGEEDLYLQKGQCTSLLKVADAFAYKGDFTLTVYVKQT